MKTKAIILTLLLLVAIGAATWALVGRPQEPAQVFCTQEAKICPDGSAVGRSGSKCEFSPCPKAEAKEGTGSAALGEKISIAGMSITPLTVEGDSRCPAGVQCIWAGTVDLRVKLEGGGKALEATLSLQKPFTFGNKSVVLTSVAPEKARTPIASKEYRFTFSVLTLSTGYRNATYTIDGTPVTLVNGVAEVAAAPGSASKLRTAYFGNEARGDLNGDGKEDVAFLVTQSGGGSGTFYYAVVALATENGFSGTNAVLLGDRVAPQTTEIRNGVVIVNYADRKSGEPMTTAPSNGVSKYLVVRNGVLGVQ